MGARLKEKYQTEIVPKLQEEFGYQNKLACPRVEKLVLNMGVGSAAQNSKDLELAKNDLATITGQKPIDTLAKKAIASFKIRKGNKIGTKVTLRGDQMYEFLDKLFNIALPRVRDFQGVSLNAFDQAGNYTLGIQEQSIFPEIDYAKMDKTRSLEITMVVKARNLKEARELLTLLGMPFRKSEKD